MIFAKVDVGLPSHQRFLRIPRGIRAASLGVWLAATLYTRERELDGFCPAEAIDGIAPTEALDALVSAGLFAATDRDGVAGFAVVKYSEHNETKAQIQARRGDDRDRKSRKSTGRNSDSVRIPSGIQPQAGVGIPVSDSDSGSEISEGERERVATGLALLAPADIPLTESLLASCTMAGTRAPTRDDINACLANARKKGLIRADWEQEVVSWMIRAKSFDRPGGPRSTSPEPSKSPAHQPIAMLRPAAGGPRG